MKCPKCKSENVSVDLVQVEGKTKKHGNGLGGHINNFFLGETLNTQLWYPLIKGEVNIDTGIKKVTPVVQTKIDELTMQSMGG